MPTWRWQRWWRCTGGCSMERMGQGEAEVWWMPPNGRGPRIVMLGTWLERRSGGFRRPLVAARSAIRQGVLGRHILLALLLVLGCQGPLGVESPEPTVPASGPDPPPGMVK